MSVLPRPGRPAAGGVSEAGPDVLLVEDRATWDRLVLELPHAALEQSHGWSEALRASGATPLRYAVLDAGRAVAAASLLAWRLPLLGLSILYASRGPLVELEAPAAWRGLCGALADAAARTRAVVIRASPAVPAERADVHAALLAHGFRRLPDEWTVWNAPRIVMALDLRPGPEEVWRRLSTTRRREIRLAERAGVSVTAAAGPDDLRAFHALLVQTGRRKGIPVRRAPHFERLWHACRTAGTGFFVLARQGGTVVGGLFGARFGRVAYLLYSAVARGHGDPATAPAGPLLYWRFIEWALAEGCEAVHWGGSGTRLPPTPRDPGWGLYQFKRSFGSTCFAYLGYYDLVVRPLAYAALRTLERRCGAWLWRLRGRLNR